jgi:hypothetical protein
MENAPHCFARVFFREMFPGYVINVGYAVSCKAAFYFFACDEQDDFFSVCPEWLSGSDGI